MFEAYQLAQRALADLKAAVYAALEAASEGLTNAELGRILGIFAGQVEHESHISRTLLAIMENEGVVHQAFESKRWTVVRHVPIEIEAEPAALESLSYHADSLNQVALPETEPATEYPAILFHRKLLSDGEGRKLQRKRNAQKLDGPTSSSWPTTNGRSPTY